MAEQQQSISAVDTAAADSSTEKDHSDWRTGQDAHVVILRSGEGFYGIDINIVQEIVLMQEITNIPGSASYIAGMTDLRGRVVPVAQFSTLLGNVVSGQSDETRVLVVEQGGGHIGLVVDAVTEVMMVGGDKIEDAATIGAQEHEFIVAVAKLEDHLVSLVNIDSLLLAADNNKELSLIAADNSKRESEAAKAAEATEAAA